MLFIDTLRIDFIDHKIKINSYILTNFIFYNLLYFNFAYLNILSLFYLYLNFSDNFLIYPYLKNLIVLSLLIINGNYLILFSFGLIIIFKFSSKYFKISLKLCGELIENIGSFLLTIYYHINNLEEMINNLNVYNQKFKNFILNLERYNSKNLISFSNSLNDKKLISYSNHNLNDKKLISYSTYNLTEEKIISYSTSNLTFNISTILNKIKNYEKIINNLLNNTNSFTQQTDFNLKTIKYNLKEINLYIHENLNVITNNLINSNNSLKENIFISQPIEFNYIVQYLLNYVIYNFDDMLKELNKYKMLVHQNNLNKEIINYQKIILDLKGKILIFFENLLNVLISVNNYTRETTNLFLSYEPNFISSIILKNFMASFSDINMNINRLNNLYYQNFNLLVEKLEGINLKIKKIIEDIEKNKNYRYMLKYKNGVRKVGERIDRFGKYLQKNF